MSSLEVIATPRFSKADLAWLAGLRRALARNIGAPHFTLVFPGSDLDAPSYAAEVRSRAAGVRRIRLRLRSAIVVPDPQVRACHVFLVPDEGFGALVRLHERLHAGRLATCLRPDMPYLPHLTVASLDGVDEARRLAAKLNEQDISIKGTIEELEVQRRDGEVARCYARVPLARAGLFG
jgi:2'-5' RNA ligase